MTVWIKRLQLRETPELGAELKAHALLHRSRAGFYLFFSFNLFSGPQDRLKESSDAVDAEVSTRTFVSSKKRNAVEHLVLHQNFQVGAL